MDLESKVKKVREVGERLEDLRAGCQLWMAGRPGARVFLERACPLIPAPGCPGPR